MVGSSRMSGVNKLWTGKSKSICSFIINLIVAGMVFRNFPYYCRCYWWNYLDLKLGKSDEKGNLFECVMWCLQPVSPNTLTDQYKTKKLYNGIKSLDISKAFTPQKWNL
jgi:hypothetical protein